jgi:hypothetical protein
MDDNLMALQAQLMGLSAALTLIADQHPNQDALRAAIPTMREALMSHNLHSTLPDWAAEIALRQFEAPLRTALKD